MTSNRDTASVLHSVCNLHRSLLVSSFLDPYIGRMEEYTRSVEGLNKIPVRISAPKGEIIVPQH